MSRSAIQFGREIYSSQKCDDLPLVELGSLTDQIYASYSGPDTGLAFGVDNREYGDEGEIAGAKSWNVKEQKAYGICMSLYEQHPVNGKMSGDPVADAFAICARGNNCIMMIADGVNWGDKSRLAARCALYGSMNYINSRIFTRGRRPTSTHDVFHVLRASFTKAHNEILEREGGLTTMCVCMVCPVKRSGQFAVCSLNVGDSYGYIFSHNQGIREVTQGSHDVSLVRDIRDAGGALGPVDGTNPELHNMTYGLSFANTGDMVFLTTDGISDNYDPVVTKVAVAKREKMDNLKPEESKLEDSDYDNVESEMSVTQTTSSDTNAGKPEMEPKERHLYAMKEMERILHEHEFITEEQVSAQEMCSAVVQHALLITDQKRKVLENPDLYKQKRLSQKDKKRRDSEIVSKMSEAPGKLDHASIVAYEVGIMRPDEDTMDCIPLEDSSSLNSSNQGSMLDNSHTKVTSPGSSSKKIRPKKLFNKLRNNLSLGPSQSSPTTEHIPSFPVSSPKKFSLKRNRSKTESSGALSPTSPMASTSFHSPTYESFRFPTSPTSPTPMSPGTPTHGLPLPAQHPYRKSIAFESSV